MAHIRQSKPDSGLGYRASMLVVKSRYVPEEVRFACVTSANRCVFVCRVLEPVRVFRGRSVRRLPPCFRVRQPLRFLCDLRGGLLALDVSGQVQIRPRRGAFSPHRIRESARFRRIVSVKRRIGHI